MMTNINLGLCCINTELRSRTPPIFSSRTLRLSTLEKKGMNYLKELVIQNILDTYKILQENYNTGIRVFRISSEIFPHVTNEKCGGYDITFATQYLKELGNQARKYKQRITAHPGQYNVLGSPKENVVNNTVRYLNFQAAMFDIMEMDQNSIMVIHGGGVYGNIEKTKVRWIENFGLLSPSAQKRLVLENCEKCFSIRDCLDISHGIKEKYGFFLPVIIDSHHYNCYNKLHPNLIQENIQNLIPEVIQTFVERNIKMKVHISEQGNGKIGHHSDYIEEIPSYFLEIWDLYQIPIDIMVEAKAKEKALHQLYQKYKNDF